MMGTAEWALLIAAISAAVSLGNLTWNVWSKFIQVGPRVRVHAAVRLQFEIGSDWTSPDYISVTATNHGPGDVTVTHAIGKPRWKPFGKRSMYLLKPAASRSPWDLEEQFDISGGGKLPVKLAVGESITLDFPISLTMFDPQRSAGAIGVADSLGRNHWAPARRFRELTREVANARAKLKAEG